MAGSKPGEQPGASAGGPGRRLDRAPGERYLPPDAEGPGAEAGQAWSTLRLPLVKAIAVAVAGAVAMFAVGAIFASTAGLLFPAGLAGGAIGLLLARAAAPGPTGGRAVPRTRVTWLAIGVAIASVVAGAILTWLYALGEGGTLGLVDYLLETFGPFIPGELAIAAITAAWGATAGPVQG